MTSWFEIPKGRLRLRTFRLHVLGACLNMPGTWLLRWTPTADTLLWAPYHPFQVPVGRVVLQFLLQETWVIPAPHPCRMNPEGWSPSQCCWSTCQWPPDGQVWLFWQVRPQQRSAGALGKGLLALKVNTREWAPHLPFDTLPCGRNSWRPPSDVQAYN